jgi:hypothetical protein
MENNLFKDGLDEEMIKDMGSAEILSCEHCDGDIEHWYYFCPLCGNISKHGKELCNLDKIDISLCKEESHMNIEFASGMVNLFINVKEEAEWQTHAIAHGNSLLIDKLLERGIINNCIRYESVEGDIECECNVHFGKLLELIFKTTKEP